MKTFAEIAFTPGVRDLQSRDGSRETYARVEAAGAPEGLGPREAEFLARADHFYLATVGESGWPYVQHRGGPRGFVRMLSPVRLAYADFGGNRQFVSVGNARHDERASLLFMDYANRRRLKLLGRLHFADVVSADPALARAVALPDYSARIERVAVIEVDAFNWNCPQHITPRYTLDELRRLEPAQAT